MSGNFAVRDAEPIPETPTQKPQEQALTEEERQLQLEYQIEQKKIKGGVTHTQYNNGKFHFYCLNAC